MKQSKLKIAIPIFFLISILFFGYHYIYFGSFTRSCIYTESALPVPGQLAKGEIIVAKDAYQAVGLDKEYSCLKNIGNINKQIIDRGTINNPTVGSRYFTKNGQTVEPLKKGMSFRLVDVIAVTKHGINTIDSGPGPIYYLILQSQDNILHKISTTELGISKEELFLSFADPSQLTNPSVIKLLSWESFAESDKEGKNSLTYTGKLTELPESYLENINSQ